MKERARSGAVRGARVPRAFWWVLALLCVVTNVFGLTGELRDASWLGFVPFLLVAAFAFAASRAGLKRAIFAVIPLLAVLVVMELGFHFYADRIASDDVRRVLARPGEKDLQVYVPHHYSIYDLRPGLDLEDGLKHNSLGFRDHREFDPDEDAVRIVFIGGSTTYTILIRDNEEIFTYGLEKLLSERYAEELAGHPLQVINAGLGGATSAENLIRMIFRVSEVRPDLVVIQHGINDGWPRGTGTIQSDYGNYRQRWQQPSEFAEGSVASAATRTLLRSTLLGHFVAQRIGAAPNLHIYKLTNRPREGDPHQNIARNDTRYFERNTRYMIALAREMGARVLLASVPTADRSDIFATTTPEHNALLAEIARELDVDFYDFAAEMKTDEAHLPDAFHVSQLGSDLKRDLYFAFLVRSGIVERAIARDRRSG